MIRIRPTLTAAALLLTPASALAQAPALDGGFWRTEDGKFIFEINRCGNELCGDLVWLLRALDADTREAKTDEDNPDPALRDRPICGMRLVTGLVSNGENSWGSGRFYNPDDGNTYNMFLRWRPDRQELSMRVYVGVSMLGKTMRMREVPAPTESCEARVAAAKADIDNYLAKTPGSPWVAP